MIGTPEALLKIKTWTRMVAREVHAWSIFIGTAFQIGACLKYICRCGTVGVAHAQIGACLKYIWRCGVVGVQIGAGLKYICRCGVVDVATPHGHASANLNWSWLKVYSKAVKLKLVRSKNLADEKGDKQTQSRYRILLIFHMYMYLSVCTKDYVLKIKIQIKD